MHPQLMHQLAEDHRHMRTRDGRHTGIGDANDARFTDPRGDRVRRAGGSARSMFRGSARRSA